MWALAGLYTMGPMDFCTTPNLENDMNTSNLFNQTAVDGALLTVALRLIPAATLLAALFS